MSMKDEVLELKKELEEVREESLAMELVKDYKKTSKRKDIIIIILMLLWFATIGMFVYHIETTGYEVITETAEVENDSGNANACVGDNCNNGVINGESESN